jgi:hypothetical protein
MKRTISLAVGLIAAMFVARSFRPTETSYGTIAADLAGILGRGAAGSRQEAPSLTKQQVASATLRPVFRAGAAVIDAQGSVPRNQESELAILDESLGLKCSLYRVSFGRAPPLDLLR